MNVQRRLGSIAYDLQLILLPLTVGLILALAGNPSDAFRLAFLSAVGIWLVDSAVLRQNLLLLVLAAGWWLLFLLDASLRSISWFWFDSDLDAYFILSSVANTHSDELLEFMQAHIVQLLLACVVLLGVWAVAFIGFFKKMRAGVLACVAASIHCGEACLVLSCCSRWRRIWCARLACCIQCYFGRITTAKSKILNAKSISTNRYSMLGIPPHKQIVLHRSVLHGKRMCWRLPTA